MFLDWKNQHCENDKTLHDINHSKILFDPAPREMEIKTKINKWDLMKLKPFAQQRKS